MTLTEKETTILASVRAEIESTWTDREGNDWGVVYTDNIDRCGMSNGTFAGVLGSLAAKGLYKDDGDCFGSVRIEA